MRGENLFQEKSFTGHRWGSNPGPCRQRDHCCKPTKTLNLRYIINKSACETGNGIKQLLKVDMAESFVKMKDLVLLELVEFLIT